MIKQHQGEGLQDYGRVATLGGGCFWCMEAVFSELKGVDEVTPGYSGGTTLNPTYEQVSTGKTEHAEVIQIKFDSDVISFEALLKIFFEMHDPTTLNRQGADVGTQHRSVIFYHSNFQKRIAHQVIDEMTQAKTWNKPVVTKIEPFVVFYPAEDYHRDYFKKHPEQAYCKLNISPKITKLRKHHQKKLKRA